MLAPRLSFLLLHFSAFHSHSDVRHRLAPALLHLRSVVSPLASLSARVSTVPLSRGWCSVGVCGAEAQAESSCTASPSCRSARHTRSSVTSNIPCVPQLRLACQTSLPVQPMQTSHCSILSRQSWCQHENRDEQVNNGKQMNYLLTRAGQINQSNRHFHLNCQRVLLTNGTSR